MRHTFNKIWLLWLCLLLGIFVLRSVNAADDATVTINPDAPARVWHRSTLYNLDLWVISNHATLYAAGWRMRFTNWLVAWKDSSVWGSDYAVIGWWDGNKILNNANYAWIWWWKSNEIRGNYAVIGWWEGNDANWDNSVVVGGQKNTASAQNSVVVGGYNNTASAQNSVVAGGQNNTANKNSLALGRSAIAKEWAFIWNSNPSLQTAQDNSALVNASNWTLIGTTTPIVWVNLVVDGAVRVAWTNDNENKQKWEIRYVDRCFYWYDGNVWHVLNRWNDNGRNSECRAFPDSIANFCYFGNTIIREWDNAMGYAVPNAVTCTSKILICHNKHLYEKKARVNEPDLTKLADSYYPYCYKINK